MFSFGCMAVVFVVAILVIFAFSSGYTNGKKDAFQFFQRGFPIGKLPGYPEASFCVRYVDEARKCVLLEIDEQSLVVVGLIGVEGEKDVYRAFDLAQSSNLFVRFAPVVLECGRREMAVIPCLGRVDAYA